jgi:acyl carrier protein
MRGVAPIRWPGAPGAWGREFVEPRVRVIVADQLGVELEAITPDVSLVEDLAADSLDLVELSLALETEFAISLSEADVEAVRSYRDVVDLVVTATRGGREAEELAAFVRSVIQADQLGISLGRILRVQAADSRLRRQAIAEERAMKAPIKMLFPTVLFIFPAMFVVILGPAIINIEHYLK